MKLLTALSVSTLLLLFSSISLAEEKEEIKIGSILPLSGAMHSIGEGSKKGIELAIENINSRGGVLGKNLKMVYEDSLSEPAKGLTAFNSLITKLDVPVVASELTSVIQAVKPVADQRSVLLAIGATHPDLVKDSKFGIRNMLTSDSMVKATVKYIADKGYKNISILMASEEWATNALKILQAEGDRLGFKINATETVNKDELDVKPTLLRLKAKNAEADLTLVLLIGSVQSTAIKQASLSKFSGPILSWYVCMQNEVLKNLAPYFQNNISIDGKRPKNNKSYDEFVKVFKAKYGHDLPEFQAVSWYDTIQFIAEAINAGNHTAEEIKSFLIKKSKFEGILGESTFSDKGDSVLQAEPYLIKGESCNQIE